MASVASVDVAQERARPRQGHRRGRTLPTPPMLKLAEHQIHRKAPPLSYLTTIITQIIHIFMHLLHTPPFSLFQIFSTQHKRVAQQPTSSSADYDHPLLLPLLSANAVLLQWPP